MSESTSDAQMNLKKMEAASKEGEERIIASSSTSTASTSASSSSSMELATSAATPCLNRFQKAFRFCNPKYRAAKKAAKAAAAAKKGECSKDGGNALSILPEGEENGILQIPVVSMGISAAFTPGPSTSRAYEFEDYWWNTGSDDSDDDLSYEVGDDDGDDYEYDKDLDEDEEKDRKGGGVDVIEINEMDSSACVICWEKYDDVSIIRASPTRCDHIFCTICLNKWVLVRRKQNRCPECPLDRKKFQRYVLRSVVTKNEEDKNEEDKNEEDKNKEDKNEDMRG